MEMQRRLIFPARVNPVLSHQSERRLSLSGTWRFRLDPDEEGVADGWFRDPSALTDMVQVPGCWQGQGHGGDGPDVVWDFGFQTRTFQATYTGTGWYGRQIEAPLDWAGERLWLSFGGVYPSAEVWLSGQRVGENHAPYVPFAFDVTDLLCSGGDNWLVVRVHEQARIFGFAYNWQGNWSGLYRDVELTATGRSFIERMWISPDAETERMRVSVAVGDREAAAGPLWLRLLSYPIDRDRPVAISQCPVTGDTTVHEVLTPTPFLWSPDEPNLYCVEAELCEDERVVDALTERTGFVTLSTSGKHFCINGEPYYMRGSGDFVSCPETGGPDTDRDRWRRKLRALRDYGYNYVRCQSYVYGPEYYDAADEVGLLVQSEMGMLGSWSGQSVWHVYPWPRPTADHRQALKRQWDGVVMRDVNHPSANLYCMSNELGNSTLFPRVAWECSRDTKAIKPTAFVIYTDGGYNPDLPGEFVNAEAATDAECEKPLIQHEYRWWSSYPDVRLTAKYSGAVRPYGAQLALEAAQRHGIAHVLEQAAVTSQRLQYLEAKGKMELCRRENPTLAGICHFDAMDANPSPQGVITEFYERKHADAATWLQTNGDCVLLSSLGFDDRVLATGDTLRVTLSVSDFSHPPLTAPICEWRLVSGGGVLSKGQLEYAHEAFRTCPVGELVMVAPEVVAPGAATLQAVLREGDRSYSNCWDLWLFPSGSPLPGTARIYGETRYTWLQSLVGVPAVDVEQLAEARAVVLTERLDEALVRFIRSGGTAVLAATEALLRPFPPKFGLALGHYFFTPPANYPPYEDGHDGTIILDHPMLGDLPHEGFADLHFFRLITDHAPLDLEPHGLTGADPVIRVLHSYSVARPLGYLAEVGIGAGRLVICALGLDQSLPEARYLLGRICAYASGGELSPAPQLSDAGLAAIVSATRIA
jgi:beta-galactosidase